MAEIKQIKIGGTIYDINADKATKDDEGNVIKTVYAKKAETGAVFVYWGEGD